MQSRTLINFQRLPRRAKVLDRDQADKDIREACAKAESRLLMQARKHHVTGWVEAEDGWSFSVAEHTIVGKLRLVRGE
jgi:hypothetical protein